MRKSEKTTFRRAKVSKLLTTLPCHRPDFRTGLRFSFLAQNRDTQTQGEISFFQILYSLSNYHLIRNGRLPYKGSHLPIIENYVTHKPCIWKHPKNKQRRACCFTSQINYHCCVTVTVFKRDCITTYKQTLFYS